MSFFASAGPADPSVVSSRQLDAKGNAVDGWGNPTAYDNVHPNIVDPNSYQWRGQAGAAQSDMDRYQAMGANVQNRQGPVIDNSQYNADQGLAGQSRNLQASTGNHLNAILNGTAGPSAAQQQLMGGMRAGQAQQGALAAGARGGGSNLAAAQQDMVNNSAGLQGQALNQGGVLRAQEYNTALGQLGQLSGQVRQGDQQAAGLAADQAARQAMLSEQQRGANDAVQQAAEAMRFGIGVDQMGARQAAEAQNSGLSDLQQARNRDQFLYNQQRADRTQQAIFNTASNGLGLAYKSAGQPDPNGDNP